MKRFVRTISLFAALLLSLAAAAAARDHGTCSIGGVAGQWGHAFTGTLVLPTGAVPMGALGRATIDTAGGFSGTQSSSVGGKVSQDTLKGTATVNSDCTGTLTAGIYDQSGTLLRTAVWALVFVDNTRELRGIITSLVLPDGTKVPAIVTVNAKKLFPEPPPYEPTISH